jgi:hypothetical protein
LKSAEPGLRRLREVSKAVSKFGGFGPGLWYKAEIPSMGAMSETRKLAAILVADVVGYSRLAGADIGRWRGSGASAAI